MTVRDVFAAAKAELGEAKPDAGDSGLPPDAPNAEGGAEQPVSPSLEQPAVDEGSFTEEGKILADLLAETVEASQSESPEPGGPTPGSDEFWSLELDLATADGPQKLTIAEMRDGYLRQADYTRKTQALAEERKRLDTADDFYRSFESNPAEFIRSLAVQAGFLDEGDRPITEISGAKIPTPQEIEERVNRLVEERMTSDPMVQQAQEQAQMAEVNSRFDQLEKKYGVPLSEDVRLRVIERAVSDRTTDLDGTLAKMLMEAQQRRDRQDAIRNSTPLRPGASGPSAPSQSTGESEPPRTVAEAWERAKVASET